MSDLLADLRNQFPVAESWVYFNHAAVAPIPSSVANAVKSFLDDAVHNGSTGFEAWLQERETARAAAARLLGAQPGEVAIITSTSQGLLTVAEGLSWAPGDEILVIEDDFPANQIPWWRQERFGAVVKTVARREGRVPLEDILAALSPRTRLVAVPWVLYDNGFRLDIVGLGRALADHPALFCVDAIQGLGAFPIDVEEARIDFLSADSHKWMLGMEGIGVFYVRRCVLEQLDAPFVSWLSIEDPFGPWSPGKPLLPDARRFEYAALPTMEIYGLRACLELLLTAGPENMGPRILELTAALASGLADAGWTLRSPAGPDAERAGIVLAVPPSREAGDWVQALEAKRVSVVPRGGGVRFSPHAWNTHAEVERVLEVVREVNV